MVSRPDLVDSALLRHPRWAVLLRPAAWASAYAGMAWLGGQTRVGPTAIALVWPAAGVAFLWVLHATATRSRPWPTYLTLAVVTAAMNAATGAPWQLSTALGVVNIVQAAVSVEVFRRVDGGRHRIRLDDVRDLNALLAAAFAGAGCAAPLAGAACAALDISPFWATTAEWLVRNGVSTVVVGAAVMACLWRRPSRTTWPVLGELVAFAVSTVALFAWVFTTEWGRPFSFLVLLLTVWSGIRLGLRVTTVHLVLCGTAATVLTVRGTGPFEDVASVPARASAVQSLVGVVAVIGLGLAMSRRARLALDRANERSALLGEVSRMLSDSLDLAQVLARFGELVVPRFADHLVVDLVDTEGRLRREALVHAPEYRSPQDLWTPVGTFPAWPENHPTTRVLTGGEGLIVSRPGVADPEIPQQGTTGPGTTGPGTTGHPGHPARPGTPQTAVRHPDLTSALVVPLRARGHVIGTITFASSVSCQVFGTDDLVLATQLADRAATAVDNARLFRRQREVSRTLQRSLMPDELPRVPGLSVSARYLPATGSSEVGGDWYDLVPLPNGRVVFVIGDVMGRGVQAAAQMGQVRAALRAYAGQDLPPAEVLTHADELIQGLAEDMIVTCVYGVYDPREARIVLSNAGHVPPLLMDRPRRAADGPRVPAPRRPREQQGVTRIDADGPPLGAAGSTPYGYVTVDLAPEQTLALYTDGLVESREADLDTGIDLLTAALRNARGDLEAVCDSVLARIAPAGADDTALLLLRPEQTTSPRTAIRPVTSHHQEVRECRRFTVATLTDWGADEDLTQAAELLVSELVTNSVRHARPPLSLCLSEQDKGVVIEVRDSGGTPPRFRAATPDDEGGRGLMLVAACASHWGTRTLPDGGKAVWCQLGRGQLTR
jgi:integral membrane sensor domain MASE1